MTPILPGHLDRISPPRTDDPLWPEAPEIVPVTLGWQCPSCLQCYSPYVSKCEYCVPRSYASTTLRLYPYGTDTDAATMNFTSELD